MRVLFVCLLVAAAVAHPTADVIIKDIHRTAKALKVSDLPKNVKKEQLASLHTMQLEAETLSHLHGENRRNVIADIKDRIVELKEVAGMSFEEEKHVNVKQAKLDRVNLRLEELSEAIHGSKLSPSQISAAESNMEAIRTDAERIARSEHPLHNVEKALQLRLEALHLQLAEEPKQAPILAEPVLEERKLNKITEDVLVLEEALSKSDFARDKRVAISDNLEAIRADAKRYAEFHQDSIKKAIGLRLKALREQFAEPRMEEEDEEEYGDLDEPANEEDEDEAEPEQEEDDDDDEEDEVDEPQQEEDEVDEPEQEEDEVDEPEQEEDEEEDSDLDEPEQEEDDEDLSDDEEDSTL